MSWVRLTVGYRYIKAHKHQGPPIYEWHLLVMSDRGHITVADVQFLIIEALRTKPLSLDGRVVGSLIQATADGRPSPILAPWREKVAVTAVVELPDPEIPWAYVYGGLTVFVNRQDTERSIDWHEPSQSQAERYREVLVASVAKLLTRLCSKRAVVQWDRIDCVNP